MVWWFRYNKVFNILKQNYIFVDFAVYWSPFYVISNLIAAIVRLGFMMILVKKYTLIVFRPN